MGDSTPSSRADLELFATLIVFGALGGFLVLGIMIGSCCYCLISQVDPVSNSTRNQRLVIVILPLIVNDYYIFNT